MALTATQRIKAYRQRQKELGIKQISIYVTPEQELQVKNLLAGIVEPVSPVNGDTYTITREQRLKNIAKATAQQTRIDELEAEVRQLKSDIHNRN